MKPNKQCGKRLFGYRYVAFAFMFILFGCVHEVPSVSNDNSDNDDETIWSPPMELPIYTHQLYLKYELDLPVYKEIDRIMSKTADSETQHNVRHKVQIYKGYNNNKVWIADSSLVITNPISETLDTTVLLSLAEGNYKFVIWTDFVKCDTNEEYFNTDDIEEIVEVGDRTHHIANTDFKNAFRGMSTGYAASNTDIDTVYMSRPNAKFSFIATDADGHHDFEGYRCVMRYDGFMPNAYDAVAGLPIDAIFNVEFEGDMEKISDSEALLGFDYVLVNGETSEIPVSLEIYNSDNEIIARANSINVPIAKSKHTIVRGDFFSILQNGGVGVSPDYDGEFNFEVR